MHCHSSSRFNRIIFGLVDVCMPDYFLLKSVNDDRTLTRGNLFTLSVCTVAPTRRKLFILFSKHVVKVWSSLPPSIVNFSLLITFRNSLNKINFKIYAKH